MYIKTLPIVLTSVRVRYDSGGLYTLVIIHGYTESIDGGGGGGGDEGSARGSAVERAHGRARAPPPPSHRHSEMAATVVLGCPAPPAAAAEHIFTYNHSIALTPSASS